MSDRCEACENDGEETEDDHADEDEGGLGGESQPTVSISTAFGDVELEGNPNDELDELMETAVDGVGDLLEKHAEMTENEVGAHIEMIETRIEKQKELMRLQKELENATSYHQ